MPGGTWGYDDAAAALRDALTFGIHPSLEGIRALATVLGRPDDAFASIQVTGTNGKTSVTRLTAALLSAHGLHAGAFVSPDLGRYTDRFEFDGRTVADDDLARAVLAVIEASGLALAQGHHDAFTEFELLTAAALWLFRELAADFAVLEVGMGGRWDATSVVSPAVAVITGVSLDHTAHLGGTRELIAEDKAQIIKPAAAPVIGPGTRGVERIILDRVEQVGGHARAVRAAGDDSPVAEDLTVRFSVREPASHPGGLTHFDVRGLHGAYDGLSVGGPGYQAANAAVAIAATEAALGRGLDADRVRRALADMVFPGRFEIVSRRPLVIVDGSHNPEAAAVLADAVAESGVGEHLRVLLGVLADKDARGIVSALAPVAAEWHVTAPDSPRALDAEKLAGIVLDATGVPATVHAATSTAIGDLMRSGDAPLLVTGSLTTAGEARRALGAP